MLQDMDLTTQKTVSEGKSSKTTTEPPKRSLKQWSFLSNLGDGFSSAVFKAQHSITQDVVAIKKVNVRMLASLYKNVMTYEDARRRVEYEVNVLCSLNHPAIPKPLEFYYTSNHMYVCMSYLKGHPLLNLVETGRVEEIRVRHIMSQLLHIVAHVHSKNIVHGDLKPENILLDESDDDKISVVDFGFARRLAAGRQTKALGWTKEYSPPEAFCSQTISTDWDIWSCGVIMYILLTGCYPFDYDKVNWLAADQSVSLCCPEFLSNEAVEVFVAMLTVDKEIRPSAHEILQMPFFTCELSSSEED